MYKIHYGHTHSGCDHCLHHCSHCDVVYCCKCGREWRNHCGCGYPYTYPYTLPYTWYYYGDLGTSGTITYTSGTMGTATGGGGTMTASTAKIKQHAHTHSNKSK